jgi:hypothetical protein
MVMEKQIIFTEDLIILITEEGKEASMPLSWFPRLMNASEEDRCRYELSPFGVHWPELDADLSFEGFEKFEPGVVEKETL